MSLNVLYTTLQHPPISLSLLKSSPIPIPSLPCLSQRLLNTSTELRNPKRLRNNIIHTRLQRNLHLLRPHICRNRNNRNVTVDNPLTLELADIADAS